jgi:hypothetical protein
MVQNLSEIVDPLVDNGLYENAETAIKDLMANHILHQIEHYREIISQYENKYGMTYTLFSAYVKERAKILASDTSIQKNFMIEEDDAQDWKIASDMLQSWMGLKSTGSK